MFILKNNPNLHSLANNVVIAVFGLLNFLVLTRLLTAEDLGAWVIFIAGTSLMEKIRSGFFQSGFLHFLAGASREEKRQLIPTAFWFALFSTFLLQSLVIIADLLFNFPPTFQAFFSFFPYVFLCTYPVYFSFWVKFSERNFLQVLLLRLLVFGSFFGFLMGCYLRFWPAQLSRIGLAYALLHLMAGVLPFLFGWVKFPSFSFHRKWAQSLFHYGKYALGSNLSDHLLKSIDSFMIGAAFTGKEVAIYFLPLKVVEGYEIIARSIAISIFSPLSQFYHQQKLRHWQYEWHLYSGLLLGGFMLITALLLPFSYQLIALLGGGNYPEAEPILIWMLIAYLFVALFRMTDTGLETVGKPQAVFLKNLVLLAFNFCGNLIAILHFQSLQGVAIVSVMVFGAGTAIGWIFLNQQVSLSVLRLVKVPYRFLAQKLKT